MAQEGSPVSIAKACQLAGLPRRTFYYQSKRRERRINDALAVRIKRVIDTLPYAGYRTVAWLLGENKNTVQRIFQLKGWQVRKRRPEKSAKDYLHNRAILFSSRSKSSKFAIERITGWLSSFPAPKNYRKKRALPYCEMLVAPWRISFP